jgi:hypothetical protein
VQLEAAILLEAEEVVQLLHVSIKRGLPPVQVVGTEEVTVLAFVPSPWQADQSE